MKKGKTVLRSAERVRASTIPAEGLELIFSGIDIEKQEKGNMYVMSGRSKNNEEIEVTFYSKRLYSLVKKWEKDLQGKKIIITGSGQDAQRQYEIEVL